MPQMAFPSVSHVSSNSHPFWVVTANGMMPCVHPMCAFSSFLGCRKDTWPCLCVHDPVCLRLHICVFEFVCACISHMAVLACVFVSVGLMPIVSVCLSLYVDQHFLSTWCGLQHPHWPSPSCRGKAQHQKRAPDGTRPRICDAF